MQAHGGVEVYLHSFLTLIPNDHLYVLVALPLGKENLVQYISFNPNADTPETLVLPQLD
jgi:hypothetical protein